MTIMQPRLLAQTTVIERHVIRSEVPALTIEPIGDPEPLGASAGPRGASEAGQGWRRFLDRFIAECRFDDPGQPLPRWGGINWMKIPLPGSFYVNAYRASGSQEIGVGVRLPGTEGHVAYAELVSEREAIDGEFVSAGLPAPDWRDGEAPLIVLTGQAPLPWSEAEEEGQRGWFARVANQFVNSMRPRLQRLTASTDGRS